MCSWHVRKPAILKLIQAYSPDIIQLQELRDFKKRDDKPDVEPIAAFLGDPVFYPYERFISRDSGEPSTMASGVLWKTKRFRALQARSISLGKSWDFPDPTGFARDQLDRFTRGSNLRRRKCTAKDETARGVDE